MDISVAHTTLSGDMHTGTTVHVGLRCSAGSWDVSIEGPSVTGPTPDGDSITGVRLPWALASYLERVLEGTPGCVRRHQHAHLELLCRDGALLKGILEDSIISLTGKIAVSK